MAHTVIFFIYQRLQRARFLLLEILEPIWFIGIYIPSLTHKYCYGKEELQSRSPKNYAIYVKQPSLAISAHDAVVETSETVWNGAKFAVNYTTRASVVWFGDTSGTKRGGSSRISSAAATRSKVSKL